MSCGVWSDYVTSWWLRSAVTTLLAFYFKIAFFSSPTCGLLPQYYQLYGRSSNIYTQLSQLESTNTIASASPTASLVPPIHLTGLLHTIWVCTTSLSASISPLVAICLCRFLSHAALRRTFFYNEKTTENDILTLDHLDQRIAYIYKSFFREWNAFADRQDVYDSVRMLPDSITNIKPSPALKTLGFPQFAIRKGRLSNRWSYSTHTSVHQDEKCNQDLQLAEVEGQRPSQRIPR